MGCLPASFCALSLKPGCVVGHSRCYFVGLAAWQCLGSGVSVLHFVSPTFCVCFSKLKFAADKFCDSFKKKNLLKANS